MKKFIKTIALLIVMAIVIVPASAPAYAADDDIVVQINKENFPDPLFRAFLLNGSHYIWDEEGNQIEVVYDANKDGSLSEGEIANMRQLLIAESYIRDLTGVEYLTSLIEINCQRSSVDKVDFSNNKELMILNCYRAQLKGHLDLSDMPKLEGVACHNNRELTSIDISNCPQLFSLTCENTGITELDLSNSPNLQHLSCGATDISSLDFSNNPKMAAISAYNTKLTSLDVSDCDQLTLLEITGNDLAWVNIGDKPELELLVDDSAFSLDITESSFDITSVFPGIDVSKITMVSGAELTNNIVSGYTADTPVVYTYDCGTALDGPVTLKVTLDLPNAPAAPADDIPVDDTDEPADDQIDEPAKDMPDDPAQDQATGSDNAPATGDDFSVLPWLMLMFISGIFAVRTLRTNKS